MSHSYSLLFWVLVSSWIADTWKLLVGFLTSVDVGFPGFVVELLIWEVFTLDIWELHAVGPWESKLEGLSWSPGIELSDFEFGEDVIWNIISVSGPVESSGWAGVIVVGVLDDVVLAFDIVDYIVAELPKIENTILLLASLWGTVAPGISAGDVSHDEAVGWVTREATLAVSSFDVLDETTVDTFLGTLEHDTDTSLGVVSIDDTVFNGSVGRSPGRDGIFSPGFTLLVQAVESINGDIVGSGDLEALTSWVWSTNILGNDVLEEGAIRELDRNTLGSTFNTDISNDKIVGFVSKDIVALVTIEWRSGRTWHWSTLMDTVGDDLDVLNGKTIGIPEVETSGVGSVMDNNVPDGNILVDNLKSCVVIWWGENVHILDDGSITFGSVEALAVFEISTSVLHLVFGSEFGGFGETKEANDCWGKEFHS